MMALLLTVWAAILVAGDTPIGRMLRAAFVERPANWCERVGRGHVALMVLLVLIGTTAFWAGGADAIRATGMAAPELAVWATTFEIATYLDLAISVTLVASTIGLKHVWSDVYFYVGAVRRTASRRKRGPSRRTQLSANDDGERFVMAA